MIRTKLPALILPLMLLGCSALPIQQSRSTVTSSDVSEPYQLDEYAQILDTYVDSKGLVDYEGLQANRQQL
ncbi:MAG: hypothetical protein AAF289_06425, partial [Cyanobacteria bacterium P01_A01_bin.135]